ncbi:hypothetical protein CEP51_009341 [Fusarium floridanum]|uniref:Uncharacterized protein n=1 Tax=Fusarium floridanum TaxID=1325733 RepID=A0A428RHV5_9HYPO|nr:hypothetical protein CEP51_009341 [Fusarium floridanum]
MEKESLRRAEASTEVEQQPVEQQQPPSYDATHQQEPSAPEDLPILVLDDSRIYSAYAPSRTLYELNSPPAYNMTEVYGIEKMRYRVTNSDSEPSLKSRLDHIYDFKAEFVSKGEYGAGYGKNVLLTGQTSQRRTFPKVTMSQGLSTSSFKVEGLLKADTDLRGRLSRGRANTIIWKDAQGRVIAEETRPQRDKEGKIEEPPRLSIKATVEEKLFDLLVACWCARVWRDAVKDLKEPLTWEKFKRIASAKTPGATGIYGGARMGR